MSTHYYLKCDEHQEFCDAANKSAGGFQHLGDSEIILPSFIVTHSECKIEIIRENDEEVLETYKEWHDGNYKLLRKFPLDVGD